MSHTVHEAKGLHQQAAAAHAHKASEQFEHKAAERHEQVAVAAYFHAEHRGFNGGDPAADWLAAEAEVEAMLNKGEAGTVH